MTRKIYSRLLEWKEKDNGNCALQLSKTEKKYKLSNIDKGARFREYENAFLWLTEATVVNVCYNATEPTVGLAMSEEHTTRKCYIKQYGDNFSDS